MSAKEYALKFTQLCRYTPELVSNMRSRMRKFMFGTFDDLVLEYKGEILNSDMNISRLMVYIQQMGKEKKNMQE